MLTYGFYNSYEHDRVYDAEQFAMMFDGLIQDGVYAHIGKKFEVVENDNGTPNTVIVKSGRAYFRHTWTYNDSALIIEMDPPEVYLQRYDAIVLDIQNSNDVRENKIISVKGTPTASSSSDNVPKPTMINEEGHYQVALAFVYRPSTNTPESQVISQSWISYVVGNASYCPYVTGILESFDVNEHYARWAQEWEEFKDQYESDYNAWVVRAEERYNADTTRLEAAWESWVTSQETSFTAWKSGQESDFNTWKTQQRTAFTTWMAAQEADFNAWFANLQYILDGDVAGHLQNEIDEINRVTLNPLPTSKGGTGNTYGYIRTNAATDRTIDGVEYTHGAYATMEGYKCLAAKESAHAEGDYTNALGYYSHSEGEQTTARYTASHAEGFQSKAYGVASHAEGDKTNAGNNGLYYDTRGAHSEGKETHAENSGSHSEGRNTHAIGEAAHSQNGGENYKTTTQVPNEFDSVRTEETEWEEYQVISVAGSGEDWYALEIRITNIVGNVNTYYYNPFWYLDKENCSSEDETIRAYQYFYLYVTREPNGITVVHYLNGNALTDPAVHVEIDMIYSFGRVEANAVASHAEGYGTRAMGIISHVEGEDTSSTLTARGSHVEGYRNLASGTYSHVEGAACTVTGSYSHVEGNHCDAEANYAHAEGFGSVAKGKYSHAGGFGGVTYREGQFAHGVFAFGGKTEDAYGNVATKFEDAGTGINVKIYSTQDSLGSGAARLVLHKGTDTINHFWLLAMSNSAGAAKLFMVNAYSPTNPAIVTQISSVGNSLPNVLAEAITNDEITLFINNTTQYTVELQLMRMF